MPLSLGKALYKLNVLLLLLIQHSDMYHVHVLGLRSDYLYYYSTEMTSEYTSILKARDGEEDVTSRLDERNGGGGQIRPPERRI